MKRASAYRIAGPVTFTVIVELLAWAVGIAAFVVAKRFLPQFLLAEPRALYAMFLGPLLTLIFLLGLYRRRVQVQRFGQADLVRAMVPAASPWASTFRFLLMRHGLSFALFALAGPQMGTRLEEVSTKGADVVIALDVSNSMLAEDLKPSRMEVAQRALGRMVDRMKGDRMGIVVFAGEAFVQLPITADRSAAKLFLSSIGPSMVNTQGTAIGAAIDLAVDCFDERGAKSKVIIVISDGESFEDDGESAARKAQEAGIVVHTIGLGSPQGAPIPERQGGRMIGFKKDRDGQTVMTKLNEAMLQRIAAAGKGTYTLGTATDLGIERTLSAMASMERTELGTHTFAGHEDRSGNFLLLAVLLIAAGMVPGERAILRRNQP